MQYEDSGKVIYIKNKPVYEKKFKIFFRNLPHIIEKSKRKIWSNHDKKKEFYGLSDLLNDCGWAYYIEWYHLTKKQIELMALFYMKLEPFIQEYDDFNECEDIRCWEDIIKIAKEILDTLDDQNAESSCVSKESQ